MQLGFNTYGLFSVNYQTFNQGDGYTYPEKARNTIFTGLKVNNAILDVLGYIPQTSFYSGCARIAIGTSIFIFTLAVGSPTNERGPIIGRFYNEAIATGVAQIARGVLEALVPYGKLINLTLGIIATKYNINADMASIRDEKKAGMEEVYGPRLTPAPHKNPDYPLILFPLQFV